MKVPRVIIQPRRARPFFARHPWVFAGSIRSVEGSPAPGDEVRVESAEGQFIARGLINPETNLAVRLYRWSDEPLDPPFWRALLEQSLALRADLGLEPGDRRAGRLVSSEGDGVSGLTIDHYNGFLVAQFTSFALWQRRAILVEAVRSLARPRGVRAQFDASMDARERAGSPAPEVEGDWPSEPVTIVENELVFEIDLEGGQKTGFFLDQRDNRLAAARHARGRRALDLYCYTGGFSLNLARHGQAAHVVGVDSSARAIAQAQRNAALNQTPNVEFEADDVMRAVHKRRENGERFGLVVCDPPRFARARKDIDAALEGYVRVNRAVVELLEPGGILVTCSCSGLIDRSAFLAVLNEVAGLSGRSIRILENRGQPADHPVSASCLETEYLKCVVARID